MEHVKVEVEMAGLTEAELATIQGQLQAQRSVVFKAQESYRKALRDIQEGSEEDRTSMRAEQSRYAELLQESSRKIQLIDSALDRILLGTYGTCVRCEEEISPARLKSDPFVAICIRCKQSEEDSERSKSRGFPSRRTRFRNSF